MLRHSKRIVARRSLKSSSCLSQHTPSPWNFACRRKLATVVEADKLPEPGEKLHGFVFRQSQRVPELQLTAYLLEHEKTGAEYLHVGRKDENNVFSIGFKTNPPDSTGVPHILEHTTLCGSEKFNLSVQSLQLIMLTIIGIRCVTLSSRCYQDPSPTL